jgi:hypothetical protein
VITSSTAAATGSYPWLVPNTPTTQGIVRITDADSASHYDVSDSFFTIQEMPSMTVTPESFLHFVAYIGDSISQTLTIGNTEGGDLVWNIQWDTVYYPYVRSYFNVRPSYGTVSTGQKTNIMVTFDAHNYTAGASYLNGLIYINSNDPHNNLVRIQVSCTIYGRPNLYLSADTLGFDEEIVEHSDTSYLTIGNTGIGRLHVTSLSTNNAAFHLPRERSFDIPPQEKQIVPIVFAPESAGTFSGILTIRSDDPADSVLSVTLLGSAVFPPLISLSTDSIVLSVRNLDSTVVPFTIRNSGLGALHYRIEPLYDPRNVSIPLIVRDGAGNADTLSFGLHSLATYCIDLDLGENYLPPVPSYPVFDARFIDPRGNNDCFDQGTKIDFRPYIQATQIDSYEVHFKPDDIAYPVTLEWPHGLDAYAGSMKITDRFVGFFANSNMFTTTSVSIPNFGINSLLIIKNGIPSPDWCKVTSANAGVVLPGDSAIIQISAHTDSSEPGQYAYYFRITSDDPLHKTVVLSVHLDVLSGVGEVTDILPGEFQLHQNYPNPFNPMTTIQYELPRSAHVTLKVFDILGREMAMLVDADQEAGFKNVNFDAGALASGVYLYKISAGSFNAVRKMIIIK